MYEPDVCIYFSCVLQIHPEIIKDKFVDIINIILTQTNYLNTQAKNLLSEKTSEGTSENQAKMMQNPSHSPHMF